MNTKKIEEDFIFVKNAILKYAFVWKKRYVVFSSVLIVQGSFE